MRGEGKENIRMKRKWKDEKKIGERKGRNYKRKAVKG